MNSLKNKLFKKDHRDATNVEENGFAKGSSRKSSTTSTSSTPGLEVLQSHWKQALTIINKPPDSGKGLTLEGVTTVTACLERICDLLVSEREENRQQGPCLVYMLSEDVLAQLVSWCLSTTDYKDRIKYELLRKLDYLISHCSQPLLYHKPVIKPLLELLSSCDGVTDQNLEQAVIMLLHQLCVCISTNPQYLELFFNVSLTSQGQHKFLIFCMLIPYIHQEGPMGQQTRDALLLIMAASTRNQIIGQYIANKSDFCPVLATGLSALYSSLPRKIRPDSHEDWCRIDKEQYLHVPDVQSIINCLEFCNAVIQVAHSLVGMKLINFIYRGFLVPVMAPALLQNSIEEQVSAIAYLELFVRTITEPALLRAFLHFILSMKHEAISLLEWLIERISSSTKLCMVSLSLFRTLVDLNCEDVMYSLCFKYLFRLTHVMQSQKRSISEADMYGKVADKFLQLEPHCCRTELTKDQQQQLVSYSDGFVVTEFYDLLSNIPFNLGFGQKVLDSIFSPPSASKSKSTNDGPAPSIDQYKSAYWDYLNDAHLAVTHCHTFCSGWVYPWDGASPPVNASLEVVGDELMGRQHYDSHNLSDTESSESSDVPLLDLDNEENVLVNLNENSALVDQGASLREPVQPTLIDIDSSTQDTIMPLLHTHPNSTVQPVPSILNTAQDSHSSDSTDTEIQGSTVPSLKLLNNNKIPDIESLYHYLDGQSITVDTLTPEFNPDSLLEEFTQIELRLDSQPTRKVITSSAEPTQSAAPESRTVIQAVEVQGASIEVHKDDIELCKLSTVDSYDQKPDIGPFLTTILIKLEGMMNNSYPVNLLLTSLVARLACYPQPILRSFLLNHHLIFQPTVKSLLQVLSVVKQKVDQHASRVPNFPVLLMQARKLMLEDEEVLYDEPSDAVTRGTSGVAGRNMSFVDASHDSSNRSPAKRFAEFFRQGKSNSVRGERSMPELISEGNGYRFSNNKPQKMPESPQDRLAKMNTKKAVYTALILEEFVKELSALTQEQAILLVDEGYTSSG